MSIYQKLSEINSAIDTLTVRVGNAENGTFTTLTASNFSASAGLANLTTLTASNFSASAGLANLTTLTASNFSASAGLANLTTLTASNFSASAGLANLTTLTASNIKNTNEITTLDLTATNNTTTENLTVNGVLDIGPLSYDPMSDQFDFDNTTIGLISGAGIYGDSQSYAYVNKLQLPSNASPPTVENGTLINITGSLYFGSGSAWRKVTLT